MEISTICILILIGLASGVLGGMVGVGGGVIIVPSLMFFLGMSQHNAQGNSLALIMLPVGVLGVINYYNKGYVDYKIVLLIALGFILGSFLGSKISLSLPQTTVKKIFAFLLIIIACKMLFFDKEKKVENNTTVVQ